MAEVPGEAYSLKLSVVGDLQHGGIFQGGPELHGEFFAAGKIDGYQLFFIEAVGYKKDLEIRGLAVPVDAAFGKRLGRKRLYVHKEKTMGGILAGRHAYTSQKDAPRISFYGEPRLH
jgi:hypothetical protein